MKAGVKGEGRKINGRYTKGKVEGGTRDGKLECKNKIKRQK